MDYKQEAIQKHSQYKWKVGIVSKVPLENKDDLSTYYTPGVAEPCLRIAQDPELAYKYTRKSNSVAVVSDGSAVLGLGNIGWLASLPVMEGKGILMKAFADLDAIPIVLDTQDQDEIINIVKNIALTFGAINLEDIKAPNCFYIEEKLKELTNIPIFHDDQHGTAVVVLAALVNALKVINKNAEDLKVVIAWAWAAWTAVAHLLHKHWVQNIICLDSKWALITWRDRMNPYKDMLAVYNINQESWTLSEVIVWADLFVWVSKPDILTRDDVSTMNENAMVFALSNPNPEITLEEAKAWGAAIYAAGRSDVPVQINNLIAFPGILRWAIDARLPNIDDKHKLAAAYALAHAVEKPHHELLLPNSLDRNIAYVVAEAVKNA